MWWLFILLGVICEIVKANNWIIIPETAEYVLFGFGGVLFLYATSYNIKIHKVIKK